MLFGRYTQLVVESVVPDPLHVVPVRHDAVLDRVLESQDTALGLCFVSDVVVSPYRRASGCFIFGILTTSKYYCKSRE